MLISTTEPVPAGSNAPAARRLLPIVFSTEGLDPRRRVDIWRGTYESFNSIRVLDEPAARDFTAINEIWSLGPLALMRNAAPAMAFVRSERHIRRDGIDHWVIRVPRRGTAHYRIGELAFSAGPTQPFLLSLGDASTSDRTDAEWLSLYLPRDSYPTLSDGLAALGPGPLQGPGAQLLVETLLMLERRLPSLTELQVPLLADAIRAMVAACLLGGVTPRAVSSRDAALAQRERIRRVIREHIASPTLGPEKICRLAGISRSQLYRLFEPHGGVARYIQTQRLQRAYAMLAEAGPETPVGVVAEGFGFFDASAFSRAFRREFGRTPSEVRAAAGRAPLPGCDDAPASQAQGDFGGLLRRLGTLPRPAA